MALHRLVEASLDIDDIITTVIVPDGETDWTAQLQDRLWDLSVRYRHGVLTSFKDTIGTNPDAPILYVPPGFEAWVTRCYLRTGTASGTGTFKIGSNASHNNFNSNFHLNTLATGGAEWAVVYPTNMPIGNTVYDLTCYVDGDDSAANTVYIERITAGVTQIYGAVVGIAARK